MHGLQLATATKKVSFNDRPNTFVARVVRPELPLAILPRTFSASVKAEGSPATVWSRRLAEI